MSSAHLNKAHVILSRHLARTLVVAAGVAALAGCGGNPRESPRDLSASSEPAVEAAAVEVPADDIEVEDRPERAPAPRVLALVRELDLRDDQRAAVDAIERRLVDGAEPAKGSVRALAGLLADGLAHGRVDEAAVAAKRARLESDLRAARAAFVASANELHATLDADQRLELVLSLRARRAGEPTPREARDADVTHVHGERRIVEELGLTREQRDALRDGARAIVDAAFPDRRARRERAVAEREAALDAFVSETFDAAAYSFGEQAAGTLTRATGGAAQLTELAAKVLTQSQREQLAARMREVSARR
ncbi:MAG: hypothetical protein IT374_27305 [Polyangiaceae bacterium]|nr:hypothetical protein [Polyangiaceae bacterium]